MTGPLKDKRWSALILLGLAVVASLADARTDALRPTQAGVRAAEAAQVQA
ncbi:MAG: hypothetical protein KAY82_05870 [Hylemonella sp.]|nr:hypothetical protein [Hylemonella sp.]